MLAVCKLLGQAVLGVTLGEGLGGVVRGYAYYE
jgi:hypothetical protein